MHSDYTSGTSLGKILINDGNWKVIVQEWLHLLLPVKLQLEDIPYHPNPSCQADQCTDCCNTNCASIIMEVRDCEAAISSKIKQFAVHFEL